MLPLWNSLLMEFEEFKNTHIEDYKKRLHQSAIQSITTLKHRKFFLSYPTHTPNCNKIDKTISTYYDRTRGAIEVS